MRFRRSVSKDQSTKVLLMRSGSIRNSHWTAIASAVHSRWRGRRLRNNGSDVSHSEFFQSEATSMRCEGTARLKVSRSVATVRFDRVRVFLSRQGLFLESESAARLVYEAS